MLAWSGVYLLARSLKGGGLSLDELGVGVVTVLTGGVSYQLWFLPALLLFQFFVWIFIKKMPEAKFCRNSILFLGLVVSAFLPFIDWITTKESFFWGNFLNNLQFVFLGIISFFLLKDNLLNRVYNRLGFVLLLLVAAVLWWFNRDLFLLAFSFCVFYLFLVFEYPTSPVVLFISKYSFGIYLIHGLYIEGGQFFFERIGFDLSGAGTSVIFVMCVFMLSLITSVMLSRFSLVRRWHILG